MEHRKRIVFCLLLLIGFVPSFGWAQVNNAEFFNPHWSQLGARSQPSLAGKSVDNVEVSFLNTYFWLGNNNMDYAQIRSIIDSDKITQDLVDNTLDKLEKYNNHLSTGLSINPVSLAINIGPEESPITLTTGVDARFMANLQYSKVLLNTIWYGNEQYKGEEVNLGPFKLNALPVQEFYVGGTKAFNVGKGITLKPGLRLRYIQSNASVYTERGDLLMETRSNARSIQFSADYEMHTAFQDRNNPENFEPLEYLGRGFGIDVGLTTRISEKLSATLSVADIGSIRFDKSVKNYQKNETFEFRGVNFEVTNVEEDDVTNVKLDSLLGFIEPKESEDAYNMPLGTRFIFQGNYRFGKVVRNDEDAYKHSLHFLYVQGFNHHLKASENPYFSAGYTWNPGGLLNVGGSVSTGGYNAFTLGPHVSLKLGSFKAGLASNNLLPLIIPEGGTGVDASLNMALSF